MIRMQAVWQYVHVAVVLLPDQTVLLQVNWSHSLRYYCSREMISFASRERLCRAWDGGSSSRRAMADST